MAQWHKRETVNATGRGYDSHSTKWGAECLNNRLPDSAYPTESEAEKNINLFNYLKNNKQKNVKTDQKRSFIV